MKGRVKRVRIEPQPPGAYSQPHLFKRRVVAIFLEAHLAAISIGQDWIDVRGVLEKQRGRLSLAQIYDELTPLVALKEQPEIVERLRGLVEKVAATP